MDDRVLQDLVDIVSLRWIFLEHGIQQVWNILAEARWDIWVLALNNFLSN